ncbi:MAG: hypothetical protein U0271_25770 [Polyangiaceae bacterium]
MSYTQKFRGSLRFADPHCLEAGLDAFVAVTDSIVDLDDLKFEDDLLVKVDMDTSAPASMWDSTLTALSELAQFANTGYVSTEFHLDGISRNPIYPGGRTNAHGLPPRHHRWDILLAADKGDAEALRALRADGVELAITFEHYRGYSPLHLAARAGSEAAVEVLLGAGISADVAPSATLPAPLALARSAGVARQLIAAGADVNRSLESSPAIERAARHGREDVVLALLDAGAKVPESSRLEVLNGLARHARLNGLLALVAKEPAVVALLGEEEVMSHAISGGEPVVIDFLLSQGGRLPESFLFDAIQADAPALLEMALRAPDAMTQCGDSSKREDAMVWAARRSVTMMEVLARHGVPLHPKTPGQTSPIHAAVSSFAERQSPSVDWLLARGVPRDAVTADGETIMQAAWSTMKAHLVNAHGFDPATIDRSEMAPEDVSTMDRLLAAGARKRQEVARKAEAAQRKLDREAAKAQREADKATKAEAAAAAKAAKEAAKAEKEAAKAAKEAAKAAKEAAKAEKAATPKTKKRGAGDEG